MSNRAWVTLATNDSYGLGALVLAHSLRRAGSTYPAVVLITPSVTDAMRDRLRAIFAEVVIVDVLDSKDATHLALLQRPELGITFTKIHCWNLTQYEKCVFLDADTLIVQNCDELFEREELSAAPDVGWPDCFNSGVFVFKPSKETFDSLVKFAQERGSFDGGDQGLLNSYFSDWAHGDIGKHLPFLYNVTSAAFYSYLPALKHYGQNLKIIHFIGTAKPWLQQFNWETRTAEAPQHLREFLQLWWDIFVGHVHSTLETSMVELEEALPAVTPQETFFNAEPWLDYPHYEPILDPESEFPWHHPDAQIPDLDINVPQIDMTQYHDPWDIYRGHIPPNINDSTPSHIEFPKTDNHEEIRRYVWDCMSPRPDQTDNSNVQDIRHEEHSQPPQFEHVDHSHLDFRGNVWDYNPQYNYNKNEESSHNFFQHSPDYDSRQQDHTNQYTPDNYNQQEYSQDNTNHHTSSQYESSDNSRRDSLYNFSDTSNKQIHSSSVHKYYSSDVDHNENVELSLQKDSVKAHFPIHMQQNRIEHVYCVHIDQEKAQKNIENNETELESKINGDGEMDNELFENLRPRHPYDGFYLRHRMTIDSRGRKICTHEVPPTPTPSPPESPIPDIWDVQPSEKDEEINQPNGIDDQTGVAGNLARVVLGAGAQREALDDLTRRQGWEAGNIDYMGADAFDNIWAKISQTLSQPRSSPPKQSTPPPQAEISPPVEAPASVSAPAPVATPAPEKAPAVVNTPAPVVPTEAPVAAVPEPVVEAPVQADKPQSPVPPEVLAETKVPEPAILSEPVEEKAPAPVAPPAAAPVSKVVAAVPEEPKVAAPAEVPAVAAPAVPVTPPATIPSEAAEAKTKAPEAAPAASAKAASPVLAPVAAAVVPKPDVTPEKGASSTDSPPLANTPSKEEVPIVPAAKSEERRKPGKLQLPAAAADPLPTPDSELEDAAALAHAIIAGELRTPTVTAPSPSPSADPACPATPLDARRLSVDEPEMPSPPVALSQIGVEPPPKAKTTVAAQIEASVSEAAADAPRKKVVKKVLKKEGAAGGEAPVPPPRKKEKKPKDK